MLKTMLNCVLKIKMAVHVRQFRREIRRVGRVRRPRLFQDRTNPLEYLSEDEVYNIFRFRPDTIVYILQMLPNLASDIYRNSPLPALVQVLVCLRFLATGAIHLLIGDATEVSRSTAGRCIRTISRMIAALVGRFVKFPMGQRAIESKQAFSKIAGKYTCETELSRVHVSNPGGSTICYVLSRKHAKQDIATVCFTNNNYSIVCSD